MSDREGTPQNQNNGPVQDPIPHSGVNHGERNVHDFRNPDGSIMSIEDAVKKGKFRKPDGSSYTVEEIMNALGSNEPIGLAPDSIADHADPSAGPKTEAYTPLEAYAPMIETGRKKGRRFTALLATSAVLLGGGGVYAGVKALGGDNANRPVATGPAVAGKTPGASSTEAPTNTPTSQGTPEDPVSRASREAQAEHNRLVSEREPFYENPVTSLSFNGIVVDAKTRNLLTPGITQSDQVPGSDFFPNSAEFNQLTRSENFEQTLTHQQEISAAYNDGTIEKGLTEANELYGTHYKIEDTFITKTEVELATKAGPNSLEASALLAKIVHIPQVFDTIAAAVHHGELMSTNGSVNPPLSDKFTALSHMFPEDQSTAKTVKDAMGSLDKEDYIPNTVAPASARLITNAGGTAAFNGWRFEQRNDDLRDVFTPVIGIVSDIQEASVGSSISLPKEQKLNYYVLMPVKRSDQIVDVPVDLGGKMLKLLG